MRWLGKEWRLEKKSQGNAAPKFVRTLENGSVLEVHFAPEKGRFSEKLNVPEVVAFVRIANGKRQVLDAEGFFEKPEGEENTRRPTGDTARGRHLFSFRTELPATKAGKLLLEAYKKFAGIK